MSNEKMKVTLNKKTFSKLFFPLLIVCLTVVIFIWKNNEASKSATSSSNLHTIELTPEGFKPESLTIKKGDIVKFVNSKGGPFWPASDPHPAHTYYSDFDSMKGIPSGGEWSHRFNQGGQWKFHDHLSPYFTGEVKVLELNNTQGFGCETNPEKKTCWEESLLSTLNKKGLEEVLEQVSGFYETKPQFAEVCHDIMHSIGHKAYKNYLQDKDSVLSPKAFYCANGFYHGFMASFLNSNPNLKKAEEFCSLVGKELDKEAPDAELQCYHGIGHGLLEDGFRNTTTIKNEDEVIKPALANCEEVSSTSEKLYRCTSGVYNGIANFYISGEHGFKIDKTNPFSTCEKQEEKYKDSCYGNFNSIIFWMSGNDLEKAVKYIVSMKEKTYQIRGIRYLSGLATLSLAKVNPEKSVQICRSAGNLVKPCIEGLAHGFLEHGQPDKEWQEAVSFCEHKSLLNEEAESCFRYTLSGLLGWYSEERSREICNSVKPEHRKYCENI